MSGFIGVTALVEAMLLVAASYVILLLNRKVESCPLKKFGSVIVAALWISALAALLAGIFGLTVKTNVASPGNGIVGFAVGGTPVTCPVGNSPSAAPCLPTTGGTLNSPQSPYYESHVSTVVTVVKPPSVCAPTPYKAAGARLKMDSDKKVQDKDLKCGK